MIHILCLMSAFQTAQAQGWAFTALCKLYTAPNSCLTMQLLPGAPRPSKSYVERTSFDTIENAVTDSRTRDANFGQTPLLYIT